MVQKGNTLVIALLGAIPIYIYSWIIYLGATDYMIDCSKMFSSYNLCVGNKKVKIVDDSLTNCLDRNSQTHPFGNSSQCSPCPQFILSSAKKMDELYYFDDGPDLSKQCPNTCLTSTFVKSSQFSVFKYLFPNLFINKSFSLQCEICQFEKHHRTPFPSQLYISTTPFISIHSDIWGPYKTSIIFDKN
ncbi:hypothetical protein CR513_28342, partial [Mucuna pruriens]